MVGTPGTPRVLRAMNDRAALDLLLEHGTLSRTRIGKLTGLSKPTASQLLARLEAAGLVQVTGTTAGRPGPHAQLYSVNPAAAYVAGLDVTAERVRAAVADITGRTVGSFRLPTPRRRAGSAVEDVVQAVDGAAKAAGLDRTDLRRVVIGTPGAFDPSTGRLRYASHLPGWHSPTLLDELAAALPMPLEYDNDVNLAAVAEQRIGAARGHDDFVLLWNEEGIGAAIVIGGRLHRGWTGGAGEVGFLPVPGTPLVRHVAKANNGGFQELAGCNAVLRIARELGLEIPDGPPEHAAAALLGTAAARWEATHAYAGRAEAKDADTDRAADGHGSTDRNDDPGADRDPGERSGRNDPRGPYEDRHDRDGGQARSGAPSTPDGHSHAQGDPRDGHPSDSGDRADDAGRSDPADRPGPSPDSPYAELLRRCATGHAVGLASLVAVLDPELIVLSGEVTVRGGEPLRALIQAELAELAVPRPRLVLGTIHDHPVLTGALESALATTRDEVFDTSR